VNLSITPEIEKDEDGFTAWHEPTLDWGRGETKEEAISDLLLSMTESLEILEVESGNLGPLMEKHLHLLKLYVHTTSTNPCGF